MVILAIYIFLYVIVLEVRRVIEWLLVVRGRVGIFSIPIIFPYGGFFLT